MRNEVRASTPLADPVPMEGKLEQETSSSRQIVPALDGIRGSAILLVLICHYSALLPPTSRFHDLLQIGWIGVDQFFVLSGFLITGILFDAKGTRHYFRNFYGRRILRIFPLYYGFLASLVLFLLWRSAAGHVLTANQPSSRDGLDALWHAQPWLWTYTANLWLGIQRTWSSYTEILIPLWSLSVEEQFYLIWPLVICSCCHRTLIKLSLGILLLASIARLILTAAGVHWFTLYTFTATRADSLAAGALLALLLRLPNGLQLARRFSKLIGAIAFILLIVLCLGLDPVHHPWLRNLFYMPLALFFAALMFFAIDPACFRGIPKRFYENPVMRVFGGYSYGIYIIHLPLMYLIGYAAARSGLYDATKGSWPTSLAMITVNLTLTAALALVSFHFFEKRFLKLKRHFTANPIKTLAADASPT